MGRETHIKANTVAALIGVTHTPLSYSIIQPKSRAHAISCSDRTPAILVQRNYPSTPFPSISMVILYSDVFS